MDFNYHPILGLQFTCGMSLYEIDLDLLANNYPNYKQDWKKALELLNEKGNIFVNSLTFPIIEVYNEITTNAYLK